MSYQQKLKTQPAEFITYREDDAKILGRQVIVKLVSQYQMPLLILKASTVANIMGDYIREKYVLC